MVRIRCALLAGTAAAVLAAGKALDTEPCCTSCPAGTVKYYSVPNPDESSPQCGECCLNPHFYWLWKVFEPKLLSGDCTSQGFDKYVSTETDGVWPLKVTNDRYVHTGEKKIGFCPEKFQAIYADMHDGDKKMITIDGNALTIEPYVFDQKWVVHAQLDVETCSANIDFNVEGMPNPPPVNLLATLWRSYSPVTKKTVFEFTDPTGKLAAKDFPLDRWVELNTPAVKGLPVPCPTALHDVYADMHDHDKKAVDIVGTSMAITPPVHAKTWRVDGVLDPATCSASLDFAPHGGPKVRAFLLHTESAAGDKKTEFEFCDYTDSVPGIPLNHWVQIASEIPVVVV